jgi:hypothetical protein
MGRFLFLSFALLLGCRDRQPPPPVPPPTAAQGSQANGCDPEAPLPPCAPPGPDCRYEPDTAVCVQGEWRCGEIVCDTPDGG